MIRQEILHVPILDISYNIYTVLNTVLVLRTVPNRTIQGATIL